MGRGSMRGFTGSRVIFPTPVTGTAAPANRRLRRAPMPEEGRSPARCWGGELEFIGLSIRKRTRFPAAQDVSVGSFSEAWSGSELVIEEEAQHLARGVRAARVGVGAGGA